MVGNDVRADPHRLGGPNFVSLTVKQTAHVSDNYVCQRWVRNELILVHTK
jgi:hypothetical protein